MRAWVRPIAIHRRRIAFAKLPRQKAGPVFLLRAPCEIHPPVILEEDLRHRIRKGARVEILEDLIEPRDQDFTGPGEQRGLLPSKIELLDFSRQMVHCSPPLTQSGRTVGQKRHETVKTRAAALTFFGFPRHASGRQRGAVAGSFWKMADRERPWDAARPPSKPDIRRCSMVTPAGLEPATYPLGGDCSIQLSHGATPVVLVHLAR